MAPTPAEGFWCVCRKYCKGVRRQLNTASTWRRHLREAAEDEVDAIRLARRSDQFRAFINSFPGASANSSDKRSSNPDSGGDDSAKRRRMSSEPSPNHQPEDHPHPNIEEDGLGNQATDHDVTGAGDEGHLMGAGNDPNLADQQVGQGGERPPPPPAPLDDNHPSWPSNCLLDIDLDELANTDGMPKLQHSMSSVQAIRNASLDDGIGLTGGALEQLRTPPKEPLRIDDPYMELASTIFIELEDSPEESEETYEKIRKAIGRCFPDSELPSFHQTKRLLTDPSGVTNTKMG